MLADICSYLKNYFSEPEDRHIGKFEVIDGALTPSDFLKDGQFFRIIGSTFNDGVYKNPCAGLKDEKFNGAVWAMRVPPALIALAEEIETYETEKNTKMSEEGWGMFSSQSFKGYSGTVRSDADLSWKKKFAPQLAPWRKM